ncbi:MAG: peptidase T [Acholeplasmataceae bacterium]|jgi:tripeptide aminopeptidase|nr:peptidase T [Acholeplasmataceae bacterium]
MDIVKRFIRYAKIDTESDPNSKSVPSTEKQKKLANLLLEELTEIGVEAFVDEYSYVYGKIKGTKKTKNSVGFIAHLDTSSDAPGKNVKPRIIENYDGSTIILNQDYQMSPKTFSVLNDVIGDDIIVTDGNTLLGADDKAGIAIIVDFCQQLLKNNFEYGDIYLAFTPDEEIGRGADYFNLDFFKADFAYTLDGSKVGGIDYENFNAASAWVKFNGRSIHPGSAKLKLINAMHLAFEFHSLLPVFKNPAFTENREGFNHLTNMSGSVEEAFLSYIIRNHDKEKFLVQQKEFETIKDYLNNKYGYQAVEMKIEISYLNMYEILKLDLKPIEIAKQAIKNAGITPFTTAIRGGTDGARLTYMGLPCPNLGTGGYNFHGRYEFLSINQMKKAGEILFEIIKLIE